MKERIHFVFPALLLLFVISACKLTITATTGPPLASTLSVITITNTGSFSRVVHSDGNGFFGGVDLAPGTYWAHVPQACPALVSLRANVVAGRVVWFVPDLPYSVFLPVVVR